MACPHILVWNCHGAGSGAFVRLIIHLVQIYSPAILILVETRVASHYVCKFLHHIQFPNFVCSKALGFAGGIWMIWNSSMV